MVTLIADSFTDSDDTVIGSHAPETGGTWYASSSDAIVFDGQLTNTDFGAAFCLNDETPSSADYFVGAKLRTTSDSPTIIMGVLGRGFDSAGFNGYEAAYDGTDGEWQINRFDGNVKTILAATSSPSIDPDAEYAIELGLDGTHLVFNLDGTQILEAFDSTFTTAGYAGIQTAALTKGRLFLDDFYMAEESGGGGSPTPLTGRGVIALVNDGWISCAFDGIVGHYSVGTAEPPNYFHVGMLSFGTENGFLPAWPITRELELAQVPPGITRLGYFLTDGISLVVTELSTP